jgi:hypothetical protein
MRRVLPYRRTNTLAHPVTAAAVDAISHSQTNVNPDGARLRSAHICGPSPVNADNFNRMHLSAI